MGRSLALNKAGQHVSVWHSRIHAAIEKWEQDEAQRELLRKMASDLEFPPLMAPPEGEGEGGYHLGTSYEYAHIDQVNLNLMLRYQNKLSSHVGDESPRQTWPRGKGREKLGRAEDRLMTRVMIEGSGPEALQATVPLYCTDGDAAVWVTMPKLPSKESLAGGRVSIEEILEAAKLGKAEPLPGQDHKAIAMALLRAATADPHKLKMERVTTEAGQPLESQLLFAAAEMFAREAEKNEKAGKNYDWDYDSSKVQIEVQPLGKYGTLRDPLAPTFKKARFVCRRITLTQDQARNHPRFNPRAAKHLKPESVVDHKGNHSSVRGKMDQELLDKENGLVVVWECWDRENFALYYVNLGVNLFLQKDETYPYTDENDKSVFKSIGSHPGFFPCVIEPVMPRGRHDDPGGVPLLAPGIPQQLEIIKLISAYLGAVKRSSAGVYLHRLDPELAKMVARAHDGTMIEVGDEVEKLQEAVFPVIWKPPPPELFLQIDKEIARFAMAMNFPLSEITSQPVADTATQEELGVSQGNLGISEILRRLEGVYAYAAWLARALVLHFYPDHALKGMGDGDEPVIVRKAWQQLGVIPELPAVKIAARAKEANPVRVRQLIEVYSLASQVVEPMTGMPKYDVDHLLQEAAETLGVGSLPLKEITPEMMLQLQQQQQVGSEGGGDTESGKVRQPNGKKSEDQQGEGKKPQPASSQENSAARRTDT